MRVPTPRPLRSHQQLLAGVIEAVASGQTEARDILAAVTPGGGKSLLPVIAAARLMAAGIVERVCWVVPRDSLRLQAEEAFADGTSGLIIGRFARTADGKAIFYPSTETLGDRRKRKGKFADGWSRPGLTAN